jgi:hypothetical protein
MQTLAQIQTELQEIKQMAVDMNKVLSDIDAVTNKLAVNVQAIADTDQKIATEMAALLKAVPAGTTLTDAQVTELQGFVTRLQATSDASDAQVTVLKGIAASGAPVVPAAPPLPAVA